MQKSIKLNTRYKLRLNSSLFSYRYTEIGQAEAPLDYFRLSGPHCNRIEFLTTDGYALRRFRFNAARSLKFAEWCQKYEAEFVLRENSPFIVFHDWSHPVYEIPLELVPILH